MGIAGSGGNAALSDGSRNGTNIDGKFTNKNIKETGTCSNDPGMQRDINNCGPAICTCVPAI
jgi:hypothetical protein